MDRRPLIGHRLLAVTAVVLGLAAGLAADGHEAIASDPATEAVEAGQRFLDRYVEPDGRVVRRDQGGDTVSEGQAYALLIAVGVGDHARFERIWTWTRDHLQRDDALLSWHWANGGVVDPEPATDADLAAASALARAGERWSVNDYLVDARRLAAAVLEHETVTNHRRRSGGWPLGPRDTHRQPKLLDACRGPPNVVAEWGRVLGRRRQHRARPGGRAGERRTPPAGRLGDRR